MNKNNLLMTVAVALLIIPAVSPAESDQYKDIVLNGHVEGDLTLFYYNIEKDSSEDAFATALGGYLGYSTNKNHLFYISAKFHTSNPVFNDKNPEKTALFNNENNASSLTVNSEAYLALRSKKRILKAGNLLLATPMMNEDKTRIVPWSYQGFAYTGEAIKDLKVQLYYIKKIRSHTSDQYTYESASGDIGQKGITMFGIHYRGITELELKSYYYYAPELYSTFIAQSDYKHSLDEHRSFCLGVQYFKSGHGGQYNDTENKNGGDDIDLIALRAAYDTNDYKVSLNYSRNFGISGIVKGYGGLSKVYTTSMIANGRGNYMPETWMLKTEFELPESRWGDTDVAVTLTRTRTHDDRGSDFDAFYAHWRHMFSADTSIYVRYERLHYLDPERGNESFLRVIASHKFQN